jgi:hypothetical protein
MPLGRAQARRRSWPYGRVSGAWVRAVKFAYADPPYLGQGVKHYGERHADAADCDTPEWHARLIERLCDEFPDGWALSLHTPSLRTMLNLCPEDVRIGAWMKPFAAFKKNVTRAYAWEPIILRGGRPIPTTQPTVRDWIEAPAVKEPITMQRGFPGAKPTAVCFWIFDWLNMEAGDEFVDLFPGSGAVERAYRGWLEGRTGQASGNLFGEAA